MDRIQEDFERWIESKRNRVKKVGTYKDRVLAGTQKGFGQGTKSGIKKGISHSLTRKRLRPVSKKYAKRIAKYKKIEQELLEEIGECQICGNTNSLSTHHKKGRGKHVDDKSSLMLVCLVGNYLDLLYPDANHNHTGGCHGFIEANKKLAKQLGYLE